MNTEGWAQESLDEFLSTIKGDFEANIGGTLFLSLNNQLIPELIYGLKNLKDLKSNLVAFHHPYFNFSADTVSAMQFNAVLNKQKCSIFQETKLRCKDSSLDVDKVYYGLDDLGNLDKRIILFSNVDLFDKRTQYLLSKLNEHNETNHIVILQFDENNAIENFNNEAVGNSRRVRIV